MLVIGQVVMFTSYVVQKHVALYHPKLLSCSLSFKLHFSMNQHALKGLRQQLICPHSLNQANLANKICFFLDSLLIVLQLQNIFFWHK